MEPIEDSETSAIINQTPGNYPKGNLLNTKVIYTLYKVVHSRTWSNIIVTDR